MSTTRIVFEEAKTRLFQEILKMGTMAEEALVRANVALKNQDLDLARAVKEDDRLIDELQYLIEDEAVVIIATQQPVASDLRVLMTALKVTANLERIGDFAAHLAKLALRMEGKPHMKPLLGIEKMAEIGATMIRETVSAFIAGDAEAARQTAKMDDSIDDLNREVVQDILVLMKEFPDRLEQATQLLKVATNLERLGDHVTNICEWIVFGATGQHIELNE